jgi:hypothetical protein
VPKEPKAKHEETRSEIPPGAVIYGYATVEEVDGMRQVDIHGRGGRYSSLLAKKGASEVVLPGASIVGVSPNYKYVAWDGESYVLRPTVESIQETDHLTLIAKIDDPQQNSRATEETGKEGKSTRRNAEVLNILIASPSDVTEERDVVEKVLHAWNASHFERMGVLLHPVRWESHAYPASGDRPQAIINKQIVESGDILIGIFGYRLGTPTGEAQSGTIEEIEEFRKAGKYVALYFSTADVPRSADRAQLKALENYKKERQKDTLYFEFEDASALRDHLTRQLPKIVDAVRRPSSLRSSSEQHAADAPQPSSPNASHQNSLLLTDMISELEDNLDCASRPRTGDVYRRPSTKTWLENRNKVTLPQDIYLEVKNTYNRIGSWADVVASGLNPNAGSMELNILVTDLRSSLPSLIDRLRKISAASTQPDEFEDLGATEQPIVDVSKHRRSLDFLPELNPKEIELVVLAARDPAGQVFRVRMANRERISIGSHSFLEDNNPRNRAEWIGALENLVSLGLFEIVGQKGEFYRLTASGYEAADLLNDFARWSASQVTLEAGYVGAPVDSLTLSCSGIVQLPATYYEVRVRADVDVMRSEKEPKSLLIEGIPLAELNQIAWKPNHLTFVDTATSELLTFSVERTDNRKVARFYQTS